MELIIDHFFLISLEFLPLSFSPKTFKAIIWTKKNASNYGSDGKFIVVGGESAGGNLATLMALTINNPLYQPPEFLNEDTSVQGCVNLYGVMDFLDTHGAWATADPKGETMRHIQFILRKRKGEDLVAFKRTSPFWLIASDGQEDMQELFPKQQPPPILTVHGSIDTLVPVEDAREFYAALRRYREYVAEFQRNARDKPAGSVSEQQPVAKDIYVELPSTHHAFNFVVSPRSLYFGDAVTDFIENLHFVNCKKYENTISG